MGVKVSSKYQVVIPEKVRQALDLKPGTEVDVIAKGGVAYIVPIRTLSRISDMVKPYLSSTDNRILRDKKDRKF
ncbi:MAG: AbrB family transcriptional regulator [Bdellovibrio sp.]|nr:MAG: AbrB family transcriptional regulator [Bdellovibrio sp.]